MSLVPKLSHHQTLSIPCRKAVALQTFFYATLALLSCHPAWGTMKSHGKHELYENSCVITQCAIQMEKSYDFLYTTFRIQGEYDTSKASPLCSRENTDRELVELLKKEGWKVHLCPRKSSLLSTAGKLPEPPTQIPASSCTISFLECEVKHADLGRFCDCVMRFPEYSWCIIRLEPEDSTELVSSVREDLIHCITQEAEHIAQSSHGHWLGFEHILFSQRLGEIPGEDVNWKIIDKGNLQPELKNMHKQECYSGRILEKVLGQALIASQKNPVGHA